MKSHKTGSGFLVRLDRGEEVVSALADFCAREKIGLASISGIGAVSEATLAVFDTKGNEYANRHFTGDLEIASMSGNATIAGGAPKIHLHACIAGHDFLARAGHLVSAKVSITCEVAVLVPGGSVARKPDAATGLMLIE